MRTNYENDRLAVLVVLVLWKRSGIRLGLGEVHVRCKIHGRCHGKCFEECGVYKYDFWGF